MGVLTTLVMNVLTTWVRVLLRGIMEASVASRKDAALRRLFSVPVFRRPNVTFLLSVQFAHQQWPKVNLPYIIALGLESDVILDK